MAMVNMTIRFSREEIAILKAAAERIGKKKPWRKGYTVADFVRDAIDERLNHMRRNEESHARRKDRSGATSPKRGDAESSEREQRILDLQERAAKGVEL